MFFNSLPYFIFLPVVFFLFHLTQERFRWVVLLGASYGFYASFKAPQLLLVLLAVTAISYFCGVQLAREREERRRKWIMGTGVGCSVLILLVMKSLPLIHGAHPAGFSSPNLLLSLGVSYFVFQGISYVVDSYLEVVEAEHHPGYLALYLAFFPKLLQGPIERAGDLLPQLRQPYRFSYDAVRAGMLLFAWGLFQKVVIADRLGFFVDLVYNDVDSYRGFQLFFATYVYAFQIFFDFSGYTDMARGAACLFGINLTQNFNSPYAATSTADFWRRWHISFSRWILDYIFRPLQMAWRDKGQAATALALIVTFLASGLWHGIGLGFILWGGLHGIYLATSTFYRKYQRRLHQWAGLTKNRWLRLWQVVVTFHLVVFAWIFFRANSAGDAFYVVRNLFPLDITRGRVQNLFVNGKLEFFIPVLGMGIYFLANRLINTKEQSLFAFPVAVRWAAYVALIMLMLLFNSNSSMNFIYNNF